MTAAPHPAKRVAVLIDADNVDSSVLDTVMSAAAKQGSIVIACAYGPWTDPIPANWKAGFAKHGISEVEQAPGHNATDIALAIDAADLLHARGLDVVCVVSSDRDFAPLAARLRRGRVTAVLMADPAKVKEGHRKLWDAFVPLAKAPKTSTKATAAPPAKTPTAAKPQVRAALEQAVRTRLVDTDVKKDSEGYSRLTEIGRGIDAGLKKPSLQKALKNASAFEIVNRQFDGKGTKIVCIRALPAKG